MYPKAWTSNSVVWDQYLQENMKCFLYGINIFENTWNGNFVSFKRRGAQTLCRIILLHFGLVTFRINFGKTRKPNMFMMSGFLVVFMTPQINYFKLWTHQITQNNSRTNPKSFLRDIFLGNLKDAEIQHSENVGKGGSRKKHNIRLLFSEISNMGSLSLKNMKWEFGIGYGIHTFKNRNLKFWWFQLNEILNTGSNSIQKYEMQIWYYEIIISKIWHGNLVIWDQYVSKSMNQQFYDMASISSRKHEVDFLIWDQYLREHLKWQFCNFN